MVNGQKKYALYLLSAIFVLTMNSIVHAALTGQCSTCHTMHNSQDNNVMVNRTFGTDETTDVKEFLLRGTCLGCHGSGTVNASGVDPVTKAPQVYHDGSGGSPDLAGGNFAYIDGTIGSGPSNKKGHNIRDLGNLDNPGQPPGRRHNIIDIDVKVVGEDKGLTCSGQFGCHGIRSPQVNKFTAMKGAHHGNVDGELSTANTVANSYRFLYNVIGLENTTASKWQNVNASNHNEYYGAIEPMDYEAFGCVTCHESGTNYNRPKSKTMSGFCATCHGYFHLVDSLGYALDTTGSGIGDDENSPFNRHPTDVLVKKNGGEYADISGYSVVTPVARTTPPAAIDTGVSGTDAVMCLSCHGAHATDFYKMMRWDIKGSLATAISGCGNCHTSKN